MSAATSLVRRLAALQPLLLVAGALQQAPSVTSRRTALAGALSVLPFAAKPLTAHAVDQLELGGALGATCMGFGCNPYSNPEFNGLPKQAAPAGSLPYPDFLKALKEKRVEGVVFKPPMGDEAYAIVDGKSVRIGEGWPVEVSNSWSSPSWVVRILQNEGVPYAWDFNLKAKSSYKDKIKTAGTPAARYDPRAGLKPGENSGPKSWVDVNPAIGKPPQMYGDGSF